MKDRGNIKWTAMMLPEHKKMLSRLYAEQHHKKKPELDEHEKEQIAYILQEALYENKKVSVTYYERYDFQITEGWITKYDHILKKVTLQTEHGQAYRLLLNDIINIER